MSSLTVKDVTIFPKSLTSSSTTDECRTYVKECAERLASALGLVISWSHTHDYGARYILKRDGSDTDLISINNGTSGYTTRIYIGLIRKNGSYWWSGGSEGEEMFGFVSPASYKYNARIIKLDDGSIAFTFYPTGTTQTQYWWFLTNITTQYGEAADILARFTSYTMAASYNTKFNITSDIYSVSVPNYGTGDVKKNGCEILSQFFPCACDDNSKFYYLSASATAGNVITIDDTKYLCLNSYSSYPTSTLYKLDN